MTKIIIRKNNKYNTSVIGLKPFEAKYTKKYKISKNNINKTTRKQKKELVKQLLSKFAPNSIKPENDFYDYINYQWLKKVKLEQHQQYITQIDDFRLTQNKVYHQLDKIIVDYFNTHKNKLAKNLKNFYYSVIKMNPITNSKQLVKQSIINIDNLCNQSNPWKLLAFFNKDEMIANLMPIVWSINPDDKNSKIYCSTIDAGQLPILDLSVYYDDGTNQKYKNKYRKAYLTYCHTLFHTLIGANYKSSYKVEDIFDIQVEMFNSLGCQDVNKDDNVEGVGYYKLTKEQGLLYGFDWQEFGTQLGFTTVPKTFVVSNLNVLKCTTDLFLKNWNTPKWKTYWVYLLIRRIARITKGWENITFNFYGKYERGQSAINKSDAVSSSLYMSVPFNTFLTQQYVAKYSDAQSTEFVKILANDLEIVFKKILMRNTWLDPSTKSYALTKLDKFKFIFGQPEKLREDPDLNYGTVLYDNMQKIFQWRHNEFLQLDGKPIIDIPLMDWGFVLER